MQKFLPFAAFAIVAGAAIVAITRRDDIMAKIKAPGTGHLDELAPAPVPAGGH